jgi:hypothetical protein
VMSRRILRSAAVKWVDFPSTWRGRHFHARRACAIRFIEKSGR